MVLQAPWINRLTAGVTPKDLDAVHRVLTILRAKLEESENFAQPD